MNKKLFILFVSIFLSVNFVFAQDVTKYQNISKGLDNASTTEISNTSTLGLVGVARYIGMMAAAAIVTLVIFKLIEGAVLKGTYDNIYDQQKGNKIIQNAVISLLIFIFVNLLFTYINPDYGSWIFGTSVSVDTNSSNPNIAGISSKCDNDPKYISASFLDQIKKDEEDGKFASRVYLDSVNLPTIGWGFNLDLKNEPQKYLTQVGITGDRATKLLNCKKDDTKTGSCGEIKKDEADKLLEIEMKAHLPAAYNFAGGEAAFNSLPGNIQNVIKNLSYAGDGTLAKFVELKKAIQTTPLNYDNIANEIVNSKWCSDVKSRCGRLVGLVYNGKCPTNSYTGISSSLASQQSNNNRCTGVPKTELEQIGVKNDPGCVTGPIYLRKDMAQKFKDMQAAAKSAGYNIEPYVGYRDDAQQLCIWKQNGCQKTQDTCKTITAVPCSLGGSGSNHSNGTAVDLTTASIGCSVKGVCKKSKPFLWLINNGPKYGFNHDESKLKNGDNIHFSLSGN